MVKPHRMNQQSGLLISPNLKPLIQSHFGSQPYHTLRENDNFMGNGKGDFNDDRDHGDGLQADLHGHNHYKDDDKDRCKDKKHQYDCPHHEVSLLRSS